MKVKVTGTMNVIQQWSVHLWLCTFMRILHYSLWFTASDGPTLIILSMLYNESGFVHIGGYEQLYHRYMQAIPNTTLANANDTCGYPRDDAWWMMRDALNSDMPWPAFLLGQTPASIWYWCTDQVWPMSSHSACTKFMQRMTLNVAILTSLLIQYSNTIPVCPILAHTTTSGNVVYRWTVVLGLLYRMQRTGNPEM